MQTGRLSLLCTDVTDLQRHINNDSLPMRKVSQGAWIGLRHYCNSSGGQGRVLMCRWVTMCTSVSFAGPILSCQEWVTTLLGRRSRLCCIPACMDSWIDMLQWWHILWNAHICEHRCAHAMTTANAFCECIYHDLYNNAQEWMCALSL